MDQKEAVKRDPMHAIAAGIVRYRFVIILLFLLAAVYCALSLSRVKVNSDLTAFLSPETETRQGLTVMEEEFLTYASENIMISNVTYQRVEELRGQIEALEGVASVTFDDSNAHYTNASALLGISYAGPGDGGRGADRGGGDRGDPAVHLAQLF